MLPFLFASFPLAFGYGVSDFPFVKTLLDCLFSRLTKNLEEKLQQAETDLSRFNEIEAAIARETELLNQLIASVPILYVFGEDQTAAEADVARIGADVAAAVGRTNELCTTTRHEYIRSQQSVPSDLNQKV